MKAFLKRYLISGIVILVPVVVTIWVLKTLIIWMDGLIFSFLPHQLSPQYIFGYDIPGLGLIVTIAIILLTGVLARLYIGKKIIQAGDAFFARLPFGRAIYQATKQVLQSTISGDKQKVRKKVVLAEYPKAGSYAIGFLTGKWDKAISPDSTEEELMVFVPTAPNPTSGFLLILPRRSVIMTDMTPEEASKLLISGGLLAKRNDT